MTIGERAYKAISDRADQKGVGVVEYAKSIGISQPNLSHWKNAHSEPRAYLLSLMAEAGLDVHWILTGQRDGGGKATTTPTGSNYQSCKHCNSTFIGMEEYAECPVCGQSFEEVAHA